jgi:UPF0716 family protein affecting phage T7 exclusion
MAGCLLVTPGIITDIIGFSLLVPRARRVVRQRIVERFKSRIVTMSTPPQSNGATPYDEIIDVEYRPPDQSQT